jgi:hypothetical protein
VTDTGTDTVTAPKPSRPLTRLRPLGYEVGIVVSRSETTIKKNRGTLRSRGHRTSVRSEGETRRRRHTVYKDPETTAPWVTPTEPS